MLLCAYPRPSQSRTLRNVFVAQKYRYVCCGHARVTTFPRNRCCAVLGAAQFSSYICRSSEYETTLGSRRTMTFCRSGPGTMFFSFYSGSRCTWRLLHVPRDHFSAETSAWTMRATHLRWAALERDPVSSLRNTFAKRSTVYFWQLRPLSRTQCSCLHDPPRTTSYSSETFAKRMYSRSLSR